ncbi:exodeoxyribonuclease V subunit alpha [Thalassiella azotivora]
MTAGEGLAGDARTAVRARGLLAELNRAGALTAADVHVATRLGRLGGEDDEVVLLAAALAVRALRHGSVCVWPAEETPTGVGEDAGAGDQAPGGPGAPVAPGPAEEPGATVTGDGTVALPWPEADRWDAALRSSPLVATGVRGPADRPLRWVGGRLYLDRYWRQEQVVRAELDRRLTDAPEPVDRAALAALVDRVLDAEPADGDAATALQRLAPAVAASSLLTVLTGGPGTGKTTTVARLVAVLAGVAPRPPRVALAAPTGRAAARLQEAVRAELALLPVDVVERVGDLRASTVHRLLGWRPGSTTRFRHDRRNRLPHDVVVVDETSMVSLTLMSRLLEALRPQARLVLVGDPDQLASVEAGAVLGDLVARPATGPVLTERVRVAAPGLVAAAGTETRAAGGDLPAELERGVVRLRRVHRFEHGGGVHSLAEAVRDGDVDRTLAVLDAGRPDRDPRTHAGAAPDVRADAPADGGASGWVASVRFDEVGDDAEVGETVLAAVRRDVVAAGRALVAAARAGDAAGALGAMEEHRLLLAHRRGPAGVARWSDLAQSWLAHEGLGPDGRDWYPGRPLLVTTNDRDTGLYNGDTGVVVARGSGVVAVFGTPSAPLVVPPHRLAAVQTVHAMTVHRGQGSQFRRVTVVLPPPQSPLLTRELLYTAVTRAREGVRVIGSREAVRTAVQRPVRRASGLRATGPDEHG